MIIHQAHFNTSNVTIQLMYKQKVDYIILDFNTSNVTIQLLNLVINIYCYLNFNTSNVTIQLEHLQDLKRVNLYFNTSNVTIQPPLHRLFHLCFLISIHLMLLFNVKSVQQPFCALLFQYI